MSQRLLVEALPEIVIGPSGERIRTTTTTRGARQAVPKAGTPGIVMNINFPNRYKEARSVRATWDKPSDGGTSLTGYGLKFWREGAQEPPYDQPTVVGPDPRYKVFSNLEPGTTYNFRIHACNGVDSCGYWTVPVVEVTTLPEATPTAAPTVAPTSKPAVAELRKRSTGKNSVTVEWDTPGPSSATLTGFHVQHREAGTPYLAAEAWPTGSDVVTPGTTTTWTINGLINGTPNNVRIQACYGTAGCSAWTELRDADDPVIAGIKVGGARIEVPGDQKAIDIGERLQVTIYNIPHGEVAYMNMYGAIRPEGQCPGRSSRAAVPRAVGQPSTGGWYASGRIEGCPDGGLGHIRVTNRDESKLYASRTITVRGTTPPIIQPPPEPELITTTTQTFSVTGSCPATPVTPIDDLAANPPVIVDLTPLAARQASLCWTPAVSATGYVIQAAKFATPSPPRDADWKEIGTIAASPPVTTTTPTTPVMYTFPLDTFYRASSTSRQGLGDHPAYWIRVRATRSPVESPPSEAIIIIDTPITIANGDSRGATPGPGQATITWSSIHSASILGSSYPSGRYRVRYRVATDPTSESWTQNNLGDTITEISDVNRPHTIGSLDLNALYALQIVYDNAGTTDTADVYSARYSYVWTSTAPPNSGDRIAGIPFKYPLNTTNNTYTYRICEETFPSEKRTAWINVIRHAFAQWDLTTGDLVNLVHEVFTDNDPEIDPMPGDGKPCVDFVTLVGDLAARIRGILADSLINPVDDTQQHIENAVRLLVGNGMHRREEGELRLNEIKMYDDRPGDLSFLVGELEDVELTLQDLEVATAKADIIGFSQLAPYLGHSWCWRPIPPLDIVAYGCAVFDRDYKTTDIFIRRLPIDSDSLTIPSRLNGVRIGPESVNYGAEHGDVKFNRCEGYPSRGRAYGILVHEAGHALGLRGGGVHTSERDTVMKRGLARDSCSPHPLDVMAIYALYQSR